jgi:hypothetical protein
MAIVFNGTDQALTSSFTPTGVNLTVSLWFQVGDLSSTHTLWCVADSGETNEYDRIYVDTSGNLTAASRAGGSPERSATQGTVSADTWHHCYAYFASGGSDRYVSLDGGTIQSEGTTRSPSGLDTMALGVSDFSTRQDWGDCTVAEVFVDRIVISGGLPQARVNSLAAGLNPLVVLYAGTTNNFVYAHLMRTIGGSWYHAHPRSWSDEPQTTTAFWMGNTRTWTTVGSPTIVDHPPNVQPYFSVPALTWPYGGLGGNVAAPAGVTLHDRSYPQGVLRGHVRGAA